MSPGKNHLFEEIHIRHLWPALEALPHSVNDGSSRGSGDSALVPEFTRGVEPQVVCQSSTGGSPDGRCEWIISVVVTTLSLLKGVLSHFESLSI